MSLDRAALGWMLALVAMAIAILASAFSVNNYLLQAGTTLAMLTSLCFAWNIVGGYMGYPSLATATLFGLGVYADAIAQVNGVPLVGAWAVAAVVGAIFSLLLGRALLGLKGHYFAIGTIATVEVLREIANNWDAFTGGAVGLNLPIMRGSPEVVGRLYYLVMWGLALISMAVTVLVDRSKFGFGLRCIRQNESAALMVGINVLHYKIAAFIISGVISAAAGGIYASMVAFVEPKDAFNLLKSIEIPVMVMLGGMGTVLGPLVGSIVYVVLREVVWANFMNWHSAILGLLVVIVIYTMPMGLLGLRLRALNWPRPRSYGVTPRAADLGAAK